VNEALRADSQESCKRWAIEVIATNVAPAVRQVLAKD